MRILTLTDGPIYTIACRRPCGRDRIEDAHVAVLGATVSGLPQDLDALIAASDLQSVDIRSERLLGEVVAEELARLARTGDLPDAGRTGVLLVGDLFSTDPPTLGASGDVRRVWDAFRDRFRWVAGVGGNHDRFPDFDMWRNQERLHYLDGNVAMLDGIGIGGVSGIIGRAGRLMRRSPETYTDVVARVLAHRPDILLLHETPEIPETGLRGSPVVRAALASMAPTLTICGHLHWPKPLEELPGSAAAQILNVDARIVVLVREKAGRRQPQ